MSSSHQHQDEFASNKAAQGETQSGRVALRSVCELDRRPRGAVAGARLLNSALTDRGVRDGHETFRVNRSTECEISCL